MVASTLADPRTGGSDRRRLASPLGPAAAEPGRLRRMLALVRRSGTRRRGVPSGAGFAGGGAGRTNRLNLVPATPDRSMETGGRPGRSGSTFHRARASLPASRHPPAARLPNSDPHLRGRYKVSIAPDDRYWGGVVLDLERFLAPGSAAEQSDDRQLLENLIVLALAGEASEALLSEREFDFGRPGLGGDKQVPLAFAHRIHTDPADGDALLPEMAGGAAAKSESRSARARKATWPKRCALPARSTGPTSSRS
jgi:hypothetical protein